MLNTLGDMGEKLNAGKVLWGVGASILLNYYGLIDKPNDIDIIVALKDIEKADKILKGIGEKIIWEKEETYSTKYFYEYVINSFDVDVMAGFRINHREGVYEYIFDDESISQTTQINNIQVPLTSLEDWYVLYQLIGDREIKVKLIEKYLLLNGVKRPELLERALKGNLPIEVRDNINRLLDKTRGNKYE